MHYKAIGAVCIYHGRSVVQMASLSASMLLLLLLFLIITWSGFDFVTCGKCSELGFIYFFLYIYVYEYNAVKCSHKLRDFSFTSIKERSKTTAKMHK